MPRSRSLPARATRPAIAPLAGILSLALATPVLGQGLAFSDQTQAAGVTTIHAPGFFTNWDYVGGGTVGDFDGDGWTDILALAGSLAGRPDYLLMNDGDGTFTDRAADWGLTVIHDGKGVAVADYDGDGRDDVYVTSAGDVTFGEPGQHKLWKNTGSAFVDVAAQAGVDFTTTRDEDGFGAAFGDYDGDADLDLFVAGFADANAGHVLFQNDGDGTFTNVTQGINLFGGTAVAVRGFAPRFADMDGDGWPELILAADFGSSRYFRNEGDGTFTDITEQAGTGDDENGMGQTVGDWNGDGLLDWYVTSIYDPLQQWTGNKMYVNQGNHVYVETAKASGIDDGGFGWGAVAVDFDHDGLLDIAETNGDGTFGPFANEQSYLWLNDGDGTFTEVALSVGFEHFGLGKSMCDLDYDNDGDRDVVIFETSGSLTLLRNDLSGPGRRAITVRPDTRGDATLPPDGYGSRIRTVAGGVTRLRSVDGGDNYLGMSEMTAHFGLGAAAKVDELRVTWADGRESLFRNLAVNQEVRCASTSAWIDLGGGKAGGAGTPRLAGTGSLQAGTTFTLDVTGAPANAPGALVFGLGNANASLFGGTLVPTPDFSINVGTDGAGAMSLTLPWPATALYGTTIYWQVWLVDLAGGGKLVASNGVAGATP